MKNNEFMFWFAIVSLFNTNLGLSNFDKNAEAEERQKRIEMKLDKILEMMENAK